MSKKSKQFNQPGMPSGINIMGMGGSGTKSFSENQPSPGRQIDTHQMMKGNAQKGS